MGERDLILSRHFNSVWKCSGISSHFIVMLQIGQTAWSVLNLLLLLLDKSSASSYFVFNNISGLLVVGGSGRKGLGKGNPEFTKLFATEV